MRIILTQHAKTRLRQRDIPAASVRAVCKNPLLRKPSHPPTEIIQTVDGRGTLEVVHKKQNDTIVVITAYYL